MCWTWCSGCAGLKYKSCCLLLPLQPPLLIQHLAPILPPLLPQILAPLLLLPLLCCRCGLQQPKLLLPKLLLASCSFPFPACRQHEHLVQPSL